MIPMRSGPDLFAIILQLQLLGALAAQLPQDAAVAVRHLERHLYSPAEDNWDGSELGRYVASLKSARSADSKADNDPLPSLYN